jgi:AcrR family transcriptional regulator
VKEAALVPARRRYDNTLRRERTARTRDRIIDAAVDLLKQSSIRDWQRVTMRAVAERAGVNPRTVFRHFVNERALRDAVMHRVEEQAGVDLAHLELTGIAGAADRILRHVAVYPLDAHPALDPTLAEASRRQHEALLRAVEPHTARWTAEQRTLAAAMFDVLWAVSSFERLVTDWHLDSDQAQRAVTWAIGILQDAVAEGRRPRRS